ncbi:atrial natriuretic peptide receptor 1-like isoform X2 [Bolinopsis microptera]|uniref:atrial natriuretic peptide receptor 1-like isoform X2 n=1 Tax=Bolinopsis microptera TaxID=2820187 RepID=UPI003078E16F
MFIFATFLHLVWIIIVVTASTEEYGFLDLYKPDWIDTKYLFNENPSFLGAECGPASYVALEKVYEKFQDNKYGENLKLLTSADINMTEWDRKKAGGRLNLCKNIECGDEWKSSRCLERLQDSNRFPRLIIGSHKDLATKTTVLYSFLNQIMYVYTTLPLDDSTIPQGQQKLTKGWTNAIRLISAGHDILENFLKHFKWEYKLTLITEVYQSHYMAKNLFTGMNLVGHSKLIELQYMPFSYPEQSNNTIDDYGYDSRLNQSVEFSDTYFKGDTVNSIKMSSRIVLLFGSQQMVRDMMLQAYDAGMTQSNEYAFIIIPTNYFPLYSWKADPAYSNLYWDEGQASRDEDAKKAFQSAFIVTADIDTKNFDNFTAAVKEQAKKEPFNYDFKDRAVPLYAANYHDAVLLWAYAMNNHYNESAKTLDVGKLYNRTFTKDDFNDIEPITGPIELDEAGDRVNTFLFWHLNKAGQWQKIGKYAHEKYEVLVDEEDIAWPNNGKSAPLAEPECGFNGEKCDNRMVIGISAGAGALAVLVLGLAVMTYMYRKAKFEAALASMSWRIPPIEIRDVGRDPLGSSVFGSRRSSMSSNPSANLKKKSYQFFSKRAQYQNKIVALKTVLPQYMTINRALMIEMKNLKEMRNENLLTVYGCTIDNDICFLVTEYCSKGSLQDLLENDDVKLDDMLKFSLINDLAKGMRFLQASVIESHGYLKSSNCIINNHFSLKISDFSRSIFMSDMERLNRATEEARNERLVYRAPELLRMQCIPCKGTKEGDMYSFGIVVHEILVREGPFGLSDMRCDLTATEVINLVTKTASQIPYRPEFPFSSDSKVTRIISMARDAWTEEPLERPNFQTIRSILRSIRVDASGGIVENLLGRMEKYATNLEELVEERTAQLQVEKKKTDDLLESMLPKSVADSLKSGNVVPPEKFECVTIYFSDIVGFTAISSLSKPMEVLDMLNDLYTVFDMCIEKYDCYKVETIGDAYMVVSGLPVRNGDRHAAQIALMSLNFLSCLKTFVISHLPEKKLNIRIGMHSGPAVAGIVGKKMPRYCLFGDTVNTASRMESNGEPEKIQMSSQSYSILSSHGGFIIDPREGLVDMKGKESNKHTGYKE